MGVIVAVLLAVVGVPLTACAASADGVWTLRVVPGFMGLTGIAMMASWVRDLVKRDQVDISDGLLRIRDRRSGECLLPTILAEVGTATALLVAAIGTSTGASWGKGLSLVALGALVYTSISSLSWVLTETNRWPFGIPMLVALAGAIVSLSILL